MPSTWLRKDWHPRSEIDEQAPDAASFAVFVLGSPNGSGGFYVDYVARTGGDAGALRRALHALDDAFEGCTAFKFDLFTREEDAWTAECRIFHTFRPDLNDEHPAPIGGTAVVCPVPGCELVEDGEEGEEAEA
jgi:hypothetical protein